MGDDSTLHEKQPCSNVELKHFFCYGKSFLVKICDLDKNILTKIALIIFFCYVHPKYRNCKSLKLILLIYRPKNYHTLYFHFKEFLWCFSGSLFFNKSLISRWRSLVSSICVIWVFPLHFTSVKRMKESSVICLWNGVLILH